MKNDEACLCPKGVAHLLGVNARTARRRMAEGAIQSFREGKLLRTTREQVLLYIAWKLGGSNPKDIYRRN
jgi:hypothetical protein